jgi:hypothetical protein
VRGRILVKRSSQPAALCGGSPINASPCSQQCTSTSGPRLAPEVGGAAPHRPTPRG